MIDRDAKINERVNVRFISWTPTWSSSCCGMLVRRILWTPLVFRDHPSLAFRATAFNPPDPDRNIQLHGTETSKLANHQERPGSWSSPALGTRLLFPSNDHAPPFRVPLETNRSV